LYLEEEKKDESKNTTGIAAPAINSLSFGKENLPSPSLAISQKNRARVAPTEIRNPLLASRVTGTYGMKKNIDINTVAKNITANATITGNNFFKVSILIGFIT